MNKQDVWNIYVGRYTVNGLCFSCSKEYVSQETFEVCNLTDSGNDHLGNLRPVCKKCYNSINSRKLGSNYEYMSSLSQEELNFIATLRQIVDMDKLNREELIKKIMDSSFVYEEFMMSLLQDASIIKLRKLCVFNDIVINPQKATKEEIIKKLIDNKLSLEKIADKCDQLAHNTIDDMPNNTAPSTVINYICKILKDDPLEESKPTKPPVPVVIETFDKLNDGLDEDVEILEDLFVTTTNCHKKKACY